MGAQAISSSISCICTAACHFPFPLSWLALVSIEVGTGSISAEFLSVKVPGGGCSSLNCHGYLRTLLMAHILLGTPTSTPFHRHLPQVHLLAMSLNSYFVIISQFVNPVQPLLLHFFSLFLSHSYCAFRIILKCMKNGLTLVIEACFYVH